MNGLTSHWIEIWFFLRSRTILTKRAILSPVPVRRNNLFVKNQKIKKNDEICYIFVFYLKIFLSKTLKEELQPTATAKSFVGNITHLSLSTPALQKEKRENV